MMPSFEICRILCCATWYFRMYKPPGWCNDLASLYIHTSNANRYYFCESVVFVLVYCAVAIFCTSHSRRFV